MVAAAGEDERLRSPAPLLSFVFFFENLRYFLSWGVAVEETIDVSVNGGSAAHPNPAQLNLL